MTISSTINRWTYNGDGSTTVFAYTNKVFAASDLQVYVGGALQAEGSEYSVSGVGNEGGGNITFGAAPAVGSGNVVLVRSVPSTQGTDLPFGGAFPATAVEDGLDRLTVLVQQNADRIARALVLSDSDPSTIGALPDLDARAGKYLAFDGAGQPTVGASLADLAATYAEETLSGDGVGTVFALAAAPGALSLVEVFISGVRQVPTTDYILDGSTLSFISAPPTGTGNIFVRYGQTYAGVPSDGSVTTAKIAAGAVTTSHIADGAVTAQKLAGGAGSVVGEVRAYAGATAPTGWLLLNGDTVGAAASGATHQDNVYEDLFTLMWESMADARAPVSGGRGASAAADWAANKSIALPDGRGRAVIGSGTGSGLTARTHGDTGGAETHQLAEAELPSHTHGLGTLAVDAVGDHTHSVGFSSNNNAKGAGLGGVVPGSSVSGAGGGHSHSLSGTLASVGSDTAHANMQPWLALNYIVKY